MAKQSGKSSPPGNSRKAGKQQSKEAIPTLPQHNFPPPYSRLLTIGDRPSADITQAIADQLNSGNPNEGAKTLTKIALDSSFDAYRAEASGESNHDPRIWTRLYAVETLGLLKGLSKETIKALMPIMAVEDDEDIAEFMPEVFASIGEPAIDALGEAHLDPNTPSMPRAIAGDSLAEIAEEHPETRARVIELLERVVADDKDEEVVGWSISHLLDLGSRESLPLIIQAFLEERVSEFVIQMADVEEHFGLDRKTPRKHFDMDLLQAGELAFEDNEEIFVPGESSSLLDPARVEEEEEEEERAEPYVAAIKVGRNDPCPCGSGKKYKKCCGA